MNELYDTDNCWSTDKLLRAVFGEYNVLERKYISVHFQVCDY